jgi:uncharacterized protein YndB with AHSA1/START domain
MHEERFEELAGDVAVERTTNLPAGTDEVWRHVTDGGLLGEWMGGDVEIDVRTGGSIELLPEVGPRIWGTVEEVTPGERLQWTWRTDEGMPTQVEIELRPLDDGTELTVRETLVPWRTTGAAPLWLLPDRRGIDFLAAA